MTWKAYAAVSGATVLAGWVVSAPPPANVPAAGATPPARQSQATAAPSEIEREAARLAVRLRRETAYTRPARDPFRFGAAGLRVGEAPDPVGYSAGIAGPADAAPAGAVPDPQQPAPLVSLAGIAEDQVDGPDGPRVERTAVLSAPDDVLLVREGDEVLNLYRVVSIESEAVQLEHADGTTLHLGF